MRALQVTFEENYVRIHSPVGGERSPESAMHALLSAMELCGEQRCFRILAENDRPLSHASKESVQGFVQRLAFFPGLKVAVFCRAFVESELTNYYVDLAREKGTHVRYFTDREEALQWLGAR